MSIDIPSSIAVVTGAGSGIGKATAVALSDLGATVIACDVERDRLQQLSAGHPRLVPFELDVTDMKAVGDMPDRLPQALQAVNILVNAAGHDIGGRRPFPTGDAARYANIIETNLTGLITMTLAFARGMSERGTGHIVNLGSTAGLRSEATTSTYSASKHGVHGFTECLRKDFTGTGIRVSELNPGRVRTNFGYARAETTAQGDQFYAEVGACLTPEDVARAIIYALSQPEHVVIAQMVLMPSAQS
jgi:3-hydroxy acid dehydrogenase / malonic semialdehyde reductase